ncbi:MAG: ABC transporter permease [Alphaproteobacteria bacterium]
MGVSFVEMMLAWRYLRARRAEGFISITTWFAVLGIALGVATLILVTSLMNGIRDEMTSRFIGLDGHISVYSASGPFTNYRAAADVVTQVPGRTQRHRQGRGAGDGLRPRRGAGRAGHRPAVAGRR